MNRYKLLLSSFFLLSFYSEAEACNSNDATAPNACSDADIVKLKGEFDSLSKKYLSSQNQLLADQSKITSGMIEERISSCKSYKPEIFCAYEAYSFGLERLNGFSDQLDSQVSLEPSGASEAALDGTTRSRSGIDIQNNDQTDAPSDQGKNADSEANIDKNQVGSVEDNINNTAIWSAWAINFLLAIFILPLFDKYVTRKKGYDDKYEDDSV